ncbi:MAG TPA: hypothetical protein VES42_02470 [Pilimelia sp.]|nr:hypothetical protein [Pilimelia sp.]
MTMTHGTNTGTTRPTAPPRAADAFLRLVLRLDAAASGGMGAGLLAAGWAIDGLLGTPLALTLPAGAFLLAYAAWVWHTATRRELSHRAVRGVLAANGAWILGSLLHAVTADALTAPGVAVVAAQALAVLGLAVAQYAGLRRAQR